MRVVWHDERRRGRTTSRRRGGSTRIGATTERGASRRRRGSDSNRRRKEFEAGGDLERQATTQVEVAAHNIRGGDATGTCATRPVVADGPCALATTAPLGRVALRGDEHWSTSAGTFFCNEAYYRTLAAARGRRGARGAFVPVAFVHLPNETTRAVDSYLPRLADVVHALAGADRALR